MYIYIYIFIFPQAETVQNVIDVCVTPPLPEGAQIVDLGIAVPPLEAPGNTSEFMESTVKVCLFNSLRPSNANMCW